MFYFMEKVYLELVCVLYLYAYVIYIHLWQFTTVPAKQFGLASLLVFVS